MKMNMDKISQWIAILANLGVVAGFLLVAIQLQQNSQALKVQSNAIINSSFIDAESTFMGENVAEVWAKALKNPSQLSDGEILQAWGYLSTSLIGVQRTYDDYQMGLMTQADWTAGRKYAASLLDFPFGRLWWSVARSLYPTEMATEIDDELAKEYNDDLVSTQLELLSEGVKRL